MGDKRVERFDVVVIGSGVSGQTTAAACAEAGMRVAVVDREPFGGTCSRCGCIPKKVLLAAQEAASRVRPLVGDGIDSAVHIDWPALIARKRTHTDPVPARIETWLSGLGVELIAGPATVVSDLELIVGDRRLITADLVIATGARPRPLGIAGEELLTTSSGFMELDRLPPRVIFAGGGYISFEFAGLAHRAGSQVTIIHRSKRVLAGFDPVLSAQLVDRYRSLGIRVLTDTALWGVHRTDDGALVLETSAGDLATDLAVHGAGRVANVEGFGLESLGVTTGPRGVAVDSSMRSTGHAHVWAIGDAAALGLPLTPVGVRQGTIAAANIRGGSAHFDGGVTPSTVFTDPPLAAVGVSAESALAEPARYELLDHDMSAWFPQLRVGNTHAGARIVVERDGGRVAGAHLLGINADEVINVFAVAIRAGATRDMLGEALWAYPTASSDITYLLP